MSDERIYIGSVDSPTLTFDVKSIEDLNCNNSVDLIGDELASDTIEVNVFYDDADGTLFSQKYGTPIFYYSNNKLVGKYYINQIERTGIKRYRICGTSLIGLIEKEEFYGGMYTGKNFSDVVDDILFTNGVNLTKYKVYKPAPVPQGSYYYGSKLLTNAATTAGWKYRIHLEFTYMGDFRTFTSGSIYSTVLGTGSATYTVHVSSYHTGAGNLYSSARVYYHGNGKIIGQESLSADYHCGIGSKYVIDYDPLHGAYSMSVDYVDADDSTITGHAETSGVIADYSSSTVVNMHCAYSGEDSSGNPVRASANLVWDAYQVYDETGSLIIDAKFATNEAGTTKYIANATDGYTVETTYFQQYGDLIGIISDFSRAERDGELKNSLTYNVGIDVIPVRGWIKPTTRREALHQLLFSYNVCMIKNSDGNIIFTRLSTGGSQKINELNMFDDSSEEEIQAARTIKVKEYSFESGSGTQKVFDNTSSTTRDGRYVILFDHAPIMGTPTASGLTIINNNCNAAVVTGKGTITGTPYVKSESVIEYINGTSQSGKDVSISGVGLITSANSDSVLNKLKSYYSGRLKKIKNSIIYNGEKCGINYTFKTLYSDSNVAFLTKMSAITSSFVKAKCELISGFVPSAESGYTDYGVYTYGETWEVPSDVRSQTNPSIRLNIIGKGHNGTNGSSGSSGARPSSGSGALPGGDGGAGGAGGVGGQGGNIYIVTIDVTNVKEIRVTNSGYNTLVRTYNNSGTLLSTYSSASGNAIDSGFTNIFTGIVYGRKGLDGYAGGNGGKGGYVQTSDRVSIISPESGSDVSSYTGGVSFQCIVKRYHSGYEGYWTSYSSYGGGGGAAYGNNGGNAVLQVEYTEDAYTVGGKGADAIAPQNVYTEYGSGGFGGNGGGGGGGAGTVTREEGETGGSYTTYYLGAGGYGSGSSGTQGIDGCVIVYY